MAPDRLTIRNLTSRRHVLAAIREYDRRGPGDFRAQYGYGLSRRHRLSYKGNLYDSKAIAGVAWGLQHFNDGGRRPSSYTGGMHTSVRALEALGFEIVSDGQSQAARLAPGRSYSWEELGETFDFPPNYLGRAGGMISRPDLNSLLLITHSQDGRSFSYGDKWDGDDLIYAGRGLTGHQELKGQNRQVADNLRDLFLFEYAGRRQLYFHGEVQCVDYYESTGFDKNGKDRRVYRFRLRVVGRQRRRSRRPQKKVETGATPRSRSSFQPRPFDPERTPKERRRAAPADPESQKVAAEQADKAHQATLKTFGLWLAENNWQNLEEIDGAIDLLAQAPSRQRKRRTLFEIKSIRPTTERSRVRSALAQLLEYRLFLGAKTDRLCLVTDGPIAERRLRLLDSLSIGHAYVEKKQVQISGTRSSRMLFPKQS